MHHQRASRIFRPTLFSLYLFVSLALIVAVSVPSIGAEGFPRTIVDGLGVEIVLDSPPQRIFSTGLAMENILLEITDSSRIVGITRFALDPGQSYVADKVTGDMVIIDQLNPEQIVAANPDIVLVAWWSDADAMQQIKDLGLNVYTFTAFDTLQDALDNIIRIGEITGDDAAAQRLVDDFEMAYADIRSKIEGRPRPLVLNYDAWGTTTGLGTSVHDIIEMAGGTNVAALHDLSGWAMIDAEAVVMMNPEVIITGYGQDFVDTILADSALASVDAVKNGRVYAIDHTDALNHHFILAIEQLAKVLHPDAF